MGFYGRHVFPRLMDRGLRSPEDERQRTLTLAPARGRVLEIGYGTGLNFPRYPEGVERIVAGDPERMLEERVLARTSEAAAPVHRVRLDAARLPFPDATFDTVVSTWTLCSIARVGDALRDVRRVLRPDGAFLFLEHGRSEKPFVARLQRWLDPVQRVIGQGCHLSRPIDDLIRGAGLELSRLERFKFPGLPRVAAEMYRGEARRA